MTTKFFLLLWEKDLPQWEYCQPNYILDKEANTIWEVKLNLQAIAKSFVSKDQLIDFLLHRANSKPLILEMLCNIISEGAPLYVLERMFKKLNFILQTNPGHEDKDWSVVGKKTGSTYPFLSEYGARVDKAEVDSLNLLKREATVVITQTDMHKHVFLHFDHQEAFDQKYLVGVLVEYIRSLTQANIEVLHFLYEMVINSLVHSSRFFQLHQFLQYHVITDSVPVACQLLSLEKRYPPAGQLALDMLKRLNSHPSNIVEVLLLRNQVCCFCFCK
jgi:regulator of MON1-CCZ1 complex